MARHWLVEQLLRELRQLRHAQSLLQRIGWQLQHRVAQQFEQLPRTVVSHLLLRRNRGMRLQVSRMAWWASGCERLWPSSDGGTFRYANRQ